MRRRTLPVGLRLAHHTYAVARAFDLSTGEPVGAALRHGEYLPVASVAAAVTAGRTVVVTAGPDEIAVDGEGAYESGAVRRVWDLGTGEPIGDLPEGDYLGATAAVAFDGAVGVVVCGYREARVYRVPGNEPAGPVFGGHDRLVEPAVWAELDGRPVVVTGGVFTVCAWSPTTGRPVCPPLVDEVGRHRVGVRTLDAFRWGGRSLIAAAGWRGAPESGFLRVFDLATGAPVGTDLELSGHVSRAVVAVTGGGAYAVMAVGAEVVVRPLDLPFTAVAPSRG